MRLLSRYVGSTVSAAILMVLAVIIGLNTISSVIDEMGSMKHAYTFTAVLQYALLSLPGSIYEFLPFAALVGSLAGLGVLASNSELVVMRGAGVSTGRVVWMVMRPALVITLAGFLISEYVAPHTQSIAKSERAIALNEEDKRLSKGGLWHREAEYFMHFNVVQPNGILHGVTIYRFDQQRKLLMSGFAERAIYQRDHWLLEDLTESHFIDEGVESRQFSSRRWETGLTPKLLNILVLDPEDLSVQGLWRYSSYLRGQGLNSDTYMLAFWKKTLQPLSTVALVLVAISFIFGPLRSVTMGFRIFSGVLVGIVFNTAQSMLAPASMVYGFSPIYATGGPIVVCLLAGTLLLRRAS